MREEIEKLKSSRGPSSSTRAQSQSNNRRQDSAGSSSVARRIDATSPPPTKSKETDIVTVADGLNSLNVKGRCDDGADDSLVSKGIVEKGVQMGIGHIQKIPRTEMPMPVLGKDTAPIVIECHRAWHVPRTILHVASGALALRHIVYLVIEGELTPENLVVGRPVLSHLGVDTETLLSQNRETLHEQDCSNVGNPTAFSGRLKLNRITTVDTPTHQNGNSSNSEDFSTSHDSNITGTNTTHEVITTLRKDLSALTSNASMSGDTSTTRTSSSKDVKHDNTNTYAVVEDRPRRNYYENSQYQDPFPDQSLLDQVDNNQQEEVSRAILSLVSAATSNGLPEAEQQNLSQLLNDNQDVFRICMSSGPAAKLPPLKIELSTEAKPVRVKLRNYSPTQRQFLSDFVSQLVKKDIIYPNPTACWASAPLLVPKAGPSQFRLTVDLRPVNKYTLRHQFPMPNLEQELCKLSGASYFANLDFSNAYWQLPQIGRAHV